MDSRTEIRATEQPAMTSERPRVRLARAVDSLPWGVIGLSGVLAVALVVRVVRLGSIPASATADELGFLRLAWHILDGTGPGLFGFDGTPSPVLGSYPIAWTMKVFGDGIVGGRMCPVLESMGTLIAFYLLARQWLSTPASLLASLLLATNVWFLNFSRTTWTNMNSDVCAVSAVLMLALAVRKGKWYYYAGAGIFAALSLYSYFSGRMLIFFLLAYAPFALFLYHDRWRQTVRGYAVLVAVCFLVFLPQIKPVVDDWDTFNRRVESTSIFNMGLPYFGESDMKRVMVRQVVWTARGFILIEDGDLMKHGLWARYIPPDRGLLDPFVRMLFFLGLIAAAWRWRETALWWVMFLGLTFSVQVSSGGTPDAARGLIVAPFMFLFVALGIETLLRFSRWMSRKVRGTGIAAMLALTGVVFVFAGIDAHDYFDWIATPGALFARRPALAGEQFAMWKSLEQQAARNGTSSFNFSQWCGQQFQNGPAESEKIVDFCHEIAPEQGPGCVRVATKTPAERDQKRIFDLEKISAALLQYQAKYGSFPNSYGVAQPLCDSLDRDAGCALLEFLDPLPREPTSGPCFGYWYSSDGTGFVLFASLENPTTGGRMCTMPPGLPGALYLYCLANSSIAPGWLPVVP